MVTTGPYKPVAKRVLGGIALHGRKALFALIWLAILPPMWAYAPQIRRF